MNAPTQTSRALVIGEALIDIVDRGDGAPVEHPGGSPMNVAVGLARLGRDVELVTCFGRDQRGDAIRAHVGADGVRIAEGSDTASHTSTALARLGVDAKADYEFDLEWAPPATRPGTEFAVVHTGSIAGTLEPGAAEVREIVATARPHATITYDPNARPSIMGSPAQARSQVERLIGMADVVKVSDEDIDWLTGGGEPLAVAQFWLKHGPQLVVVTRGGEGAVGVTARGVAVSVPAQPVDVVDTVGAGDSFMSGLIDGLWEAGLLGADRREALADVGEDTLRSILARCVQIGAITVSRAGANPPRKDELS